jgi:hypothetical protein
MARAPDPEATLRRTALRLADVAWRDSDRRRSYEWKVNFALWPALGALGGFFWKEETPHFSALEVIGISLLLVFIGYTYWFKWSLGLWNRNYWDLTTADYYWARVDGDPKRADPLRRARLDEFDERLKKHGRGILSPLIDVPDFRARRPFRKTLGAGWRILGHWSHGSQITITLILIAITIWGAIRRLG